MPAMNFAALVRSAPLAAACLIIAGCGDKTAAPEGENEELDARGEVLGGSISDEMLPLDTLTSQAPPLRIAESAADGAEDGEDTATEEDTGEATETDPAAEPESEAEAEDPAF